MARPIRLVTWNVQGSKGLDVSAAAAVLGAADADLVAVQEIQVHQVRRLAEAAGGADWRWARKHWPIVHRPEGLAVLTRHRIVAARRVVLRRAPPWSWRRRVGLDVTVDTGERLARVVVAHLSPHDAAERRAREAASLAALGQSRAPLPFVVGDLNEPPGARAVMHLAAAGWRDAWAVVHGDGSGGATNWTGGGRAGRPPTQRIDYVLVPVGWGVEEAAVMDEVAAVGDREAFAALSDHLPLLVAAVAPEEPS
jgi:endonuclease/exonuclease/phosphatase family metal-dependent hydrolase